MADLAASPRTPAPPGPAKTPWRYSRWGSIILSWDFYLGVPAGIALGLLPAFNKAVAATASTVLLAVGGALVAIAAVVIAIKTIFIAVISPEYVIALQRAPGGIKGAVRPYLIVVWVSILGAIASFAAALSWPAIPGDSWWLRWLAFSVPAALAIWGLLGSAQLAGLNAFHLEQRLKLAEAISEFRRRRGESSRSA